jgi:hypothetical protein
MNNEWISTPPKSELDDVNASIRAMDERITMLWQVLSRPDGVQRVPDGWYPPDLQGWMHEIADRLAHIEVQLARMMPLVEQAEKFVSMTPMQRIRAGLK